MQLTTWEKGIEFPELPRLVGEHEADVAIIGGGITGITAAYLLAKAGKKVICVDKSVLRYSITACTTAWLASDVDTDLDDLIRVYGEKHARDVWYSHRDAIDETERIVREEGIDCDFMRATEYFYATSEKGFQSIEREMKHAKEFGFDVARADNELPFSHKGVYALHNQAKFHPLRYLLALREKATRLGATFYENTEATEIEGTDTVRVTTKKGMIMAKNVIVATYSPFNKPRITIPKKARYISYVYELEIPKDSLPEALYLDDKNPYHYLRVDKGEKNDRLVVGGEDHRHEIPINKERNYGALLNYMDRTFPELPYKVASHWDAPVLESIDGFPFIGRYSGSHPNRYVATCFSGSGMTYAVIAARIFVDPIVKGETNKYAYLYDPFRKIRARELLVKGRDYGETFIMGALKNLFAGRHGKKKD